MGSINFHSINVTKDKKRCYIFATKTDKIKRSTILKNATSRLRRYAVDVVDTDRSVATSDKVFQDGAGESGYIGGWRDAHIFYCRSG